MKLFFARLSELIRGVVKFLTKDIWSLDFSELGKFKARSLKHLQVIVFTVHNFFGQRVGREAVALTFFSILAMVPVVAIIMFVSADFGVDKLLSKMLYESFPTSGQLIDTLTGYASNIVKSTENGLFGWISFLTFVWTVIWLMINIEVAFNRIWQVSKPRRIWKRLIIYVSVLISAPFVLALFLFGWGYYARFVVVLREHLGTFSFLTTNMFWAAFYGVAVLALSVMYKFIPSARLRYGAALRAALLSGGAFVLLQYLYMSTQLFFTRLSAVYGVLAFIPLLMVWLNICWQIILFGAMLSRGFHTVDIREMAERNIPMTDENFFTEQQHRHAADETCIKKIQQQKKVHRKQETVLNKKRSQPF